MSKPALPGVIGQMRDLGRHLLFVLAAAAAAAMAVGYAFIFTGIASPVRGDLGTLDVPPEGTAAAAFLDDGRPVFVVNDSVLGIWVLDAQAPRVPTGLGATVAWCADSGMLVDTASGSAYAANGELRWGPAATGLISFASRPAADDQSRVVVGSDTSVQGRGPETDEWPGQNCPADTWVSHRPPSGETFDPSVAVEQEPPGWVWLEGSVRVVGEEVRLCYRASDACSSYARS